jgi:serine/threonine protein kinase
MNGLKKLHNEKIVHRNLKPSNIYLSENGIYKLGLIDLFYFYLFVI